MTQAIRILALIALPLAATAQEAPVYPTPQDALDALVAALGTGEVDAALAAIDPGAGDLIRDPDNPENTEVMGDLVAAWQEGWRFVPREDGHVVIELGADDWPFPVPLVKGSDGWRFDIEAAREEILDRNIGLNELDVIDVLDAYVAIQSGYRLTDHDGDGVMEFAASIISSEDGRDGLYWPGDDSPVGDLAARASLDGFGEEGSDLAAEPFSGYYFRILTEQGDAAPGGAMSYMVNGNMVAGHALLAVPAEYGVTGVNSFIVGEAGVIYEADLGPETLDTALDMHSFDPGDGWEALPED